VRVCVCLCVSVFVCACLCLPVFMCSRRRVAADRSMSSPSRRPAQSPSSPPPDDCAICLERLSAEDELNPIVSVCRNDHQCHARCIAAWRQVRRDQIGISSTCPVCRSPSIHIAGENEQVMCSGLLTRLLGPPGSSERARAIGRVCGCCLLVTPYGILLMICIPVASRVSQRGFRNPTAERND